MSSCGRILILLLIGATCLPCALGLRALDLDDLFVTNRVIDVQITIPNSDWNQLRRQSRDRSSLSNRQFGPAPTPFTYFKADVTIEGETFSGVGLRKKGFLGSLNSTRPSLKVKLNYTNPEGRLGGLKTLTFNNNQQDRGLLSQYLSYHVFNLAGSPAPRCAFARVSVNGKDLGIYSHVETVREALLKREFQTDDGTLYEGTVVDFYPDWEKSFELKTGNDEPGREKIANVIRALQGEVGTQLTTPKAPARAWAPQNPTYDPIWMHPDFDDSSWRQGNGHAGFENGRGFESLIDPNFDFQRQVSGRRRSIYMRIPFSIEDLNAVQQLGTLALRVHYDDGFVAYLNGVKVAAANAPSRPAWNSLATGNNEDSAATVLEPFYIPEHLPLLREGRNVLAIQGLNAGENSTDMLVGAALHMDEHSVEENLAEHVNLEAFYTFWAIEGLLGFWDGYSGNRNNFFCYLHPADNQLHFLPWGADSLFTNESLVHDMRGKPKAVKTLGLIANRLWATESGRRRYSKTMSHILDHFWNAKALLAETDRMAELLRPYSKNHQRWFESSLDEMRDFIRGRRTEVLRELQPYLDENGN